MAILSIPNTIAANQAALAEPLQQNFEAISSVVNGQLDNLNIAQNGVAESNIAPKSVTTPKIGDGENGVTLGKLAPSISIGDKSITADFSISAATLKDHSWHDVTNGTTALVLPTYTPAADSRAVFSGVLNFAQTAGADDYIYIGVLNGSVVCFQAMVFPHDGKYESIPLSGFYNMTANTAYTFKVSIKTATANGLDVNFYATDGRAQFSAFAVPR